MQPRALIVLALCLAFFSCKHAQSGNLEGVAPPDPVGIAAFTRSNRFVEAKISPGGSYLAAIRLEGGKRTLAFVDLRNRKLASVLRPEPQSVGNVYWVNDSRAVVEIWDEYGPLAAPVDYGQIYAVDAAGGGGLTLFTRGARVRGRLRKEPRRLLIEEFGYDVNYLSKVDVYTGDATQIAVVPVEKAAFLTDADGEPRIAVASGADLKPRFFYRYGGREKAWTELTNLRGLTSESTPVGFVGRTFDVVEPLEKGFGLFSVNIDSGERKLLSHNDLVPPSSVLIDADHQVVAVEYVPDVPTHDFLAPDHPLARMLKGLLAAYPDDNVRLVSFTDDGKKVVIFVYSDRNPGRFLLVDVDKMAAEEIVAARPWTRPDASAETSAFHIPASDGLWIHGYITLPKSARVGEALPLVVLPHGGPHGVRDEWGYHPEVQLLASEGFAVLQVNYRGSGGYGSKYQEAGYRHWGDRIVQDIIDATRYAVRKGYADPKRICIYGGSFGGYAALQGAIMAPDLFRCAVGYAGVYDLTLLSSEWTNSWSPAGRRAGQNSVRTAVGTDTGELKRASPVYNANKMKARVLLIHGKQDKRVSIEHAERLKKALEESGATPEWLVERKEGHGFYDEDARERMYTRLVQFLHENTAPAN
jgi:dipeptidyl aminopeptidase/acylaminoacyl peptidase